MKVGAQEPESRFVRTWGPILVGISGLVFGAISFYVQYFYLPGQQPRSLVITSRMEKVNDSDAFTTVKGTFTLRNITKTRVYLLAVYYNVAGSRIEVGPNENVEAYSSFVKQELPGTKYRRFARHYSQTGHATVFSEKLFDESNQAWLDPEQEYTYEFHVYVPRGRYDLLQLEVEAVEAKDRTLVSTHWDANEGRRHLRPAMQEAPWLRGRQSEM